MLVVLDEAVRRESVVVMVVSCVVVIETVSVGVGWIHGGGCQSRSRAALADDRLLELLRHGRVADFARHYFVKHLHSWRQHEIRLTGLSCREITITIINIAA